MMKIFIDLGIVLILTIMTQQTSSTSTSLSSSLLTPKGDRKSNDREVNSATCITGGSSTSPG